MAPRSKKSEIDIDTLPDRVWYNAQITNKQTFPIPFSCDDPRGSELVSNPEYYNFCIPQCSFPTTTIPIFKFPSGADNMYYVTLLDVSTGLSYQQQVLYTPSNGLSNNLVYSISNFLQSINTAFNNAFNALVTAHPNVVNAPPVMIYDPTTQLFAIFASVSYTADAPNGVNVYFSSSLYDKFQSFNVYFNGYNTPSHRDVQILIYSNYNNTISIVYKGISGSVTGYLMTQEAANPGTLLDIQNFTFTSSALPIVKQNVAVITQQTMSVNNISSIIGQFDVGNAFFTNANAGRESSSYVANVYRLYEMLGGSPVYNMQFNGYYTDKNGVQHPIMLAPGASANVTCLFLKKGLVN